MAWSVTPAMLSQRSAFNTRFPNRRKGVNSSDGFVGDYAHQQSPSSHNPDDTPGSKSEYTDADTKQEVRGSDTDENLNDSEHDMFDVIDAIIATPNDVKRCKYLIYQDTVWSRNNNWKPAKYNGDYHNHLHTSGDPVFDDDSSPWLSILNLGQKEVPHVATAAETEAHNTHDRVYAILTMEPYGQAPENAIGAAVKAIRTDVATLVADSTTVTLTPEDRQAIIEDVTEGVLTGLSTKLGGVLISALQEIGYKPFRITS